MGYSQIRNETCVSYIDRQIFYHWATRKALIMTYGRFHPMVFHSLGMPCFSLAACFSAWKICIISLIAQKNSWIWGEKKKPVWLTNLWNIFDIYLYTYIKCCILLFVYSEQLSPCREPAWGTLPLAKVMRKEAWHYAKARSSLRRPPVPEHLPPKPESVLCSHLHLWLYGGLSSITISLGGGVNLQLQLIKIPGHDKNVSTYKLCWSFSSLPEQVRPATCDCLQPPNRERHEML